MRLRFWKLVFLALLFCLGSLEVYLWAAEASTLSFCSEGRQGTFAGKLKAEQNSIGVDLSVLPGEVKVYRAVLQVLRNPPVNTGDHHLALSKVVILDAAGKELELLPPRYLSFDATDALRQAVKEGDSLVLQVKSFPGWQREGTRLDVTCNQPAKNEIKQVGKLRVKHIEGQTFMTWKDPYPLVTREQVTVGELRAVKGKADADRQVCFRIYCSTEPITTESIEAAKLVDEVDGFTAWNDEYYGRGVKKEQPALRYVIWEGEGPVPPDTGIYAHKPEEEGRAYYVVSVAVDGEEDLSAPVASDAVEERVGSGVPILQRVVNPEQFMYIKNPTVRYYVRWESPPTCNLPSRPFDYLVAIPPEPKGPPTPLHVALHCWGGSLNGGYGWWYGGKDGAMMVATNQIPYDWWACYHENLYTLKPFNEGVARSFSPKRVCAFVEWVKKHWDIDESRMTVGGNSMGGAGVSHWLRYGDRFAYGISWVGVHIPAESPQFRSSYERAVSKLEWKTMHETGVPAFDYMNDAYWLRKHREAETPFLAYSNGKNDGGIGWEQAVEFTRALQETRRPHIFVWGQAGHGQRAYFPTPAAGGDNVSGPLDIRLDRSLPAFTNCSLDDNMGNGDPKDGDAEGQLNMYLRWETETIVDEKDRWEMTVYLVDGAPKDECTVDLTPRRLQRFKVKPGERFNWSNTFLEQKRQIVFGTVKADKWGLVTLEKLSVSKGKNRIRVSRR